MTGALHGRVALVSGGAGAIGLETARRLIGDGAKVAIADRRQEALDAALEQLGGSAHGVVMDGSRRTDVEGAVAEVVDRWGRLDVVAPFAGIVGEAELSQISDEQWHRVIDVSLYGSLLMAQAAEPHLRASGQGRVVFMSSIAASGNARQAAYSAAKAGIGGLTRSLSAELGTDGVTVNAVAPGFIESRLTMAIASQEGVTYQEVKDRFAARTAVGRIGVPGDIAALVAFLAGEDAGFISGQVITVDGGPSGWRDS